MPPMAGLEGYVTRPSERAGMTSVIASASSIARSAKLRRACDGAMSMRPSTLTDGEPSAKPSAASAP